MTAFSEFSAARLIDSSIKWGDRDDDILFVSEPVPITVERAPSPSRTPSPLIFRDKVRNEKKEALRQVMRKTATCTSFMRYGNCRYGDDCHFAHGRQEMRQRPQNEFWKERGKVCHSFADTGSCAYGDSCKYRHIWEKKGR